VLDALRDLTSPRALVVRDGQPQRIAGHGVVRGDLLNAGNATFAGRSLFAGTAAGPAYDAAGTYLGMFEANLTLIYTQLLP
jgi:hypothetical protein